MPLSMLFKKSDCIPIEYRSVNSDSPFIRIYNSYLNDQKSRYEIIYTDYGMTVRMPERKLSQNDIKLSFEIDHERKRRHLLIEIQNRFISQMIPVNDVYNIYDAKAEYEDEVLTVTIPKA